MDYERNGFVSPYLWPREEYRTSQGRKLGPTPRNLDLLDPRMRPRGIGHRRRILHRLLSCCPDDCENYRKDY